MKKYRTIWVSDIHLGTRGCKTDALLRFLEEAKAETIYFVGDILDIERCKTKVFWPKSHTKCLRKILKLASNKTKVIYIPGNHDQEFRFLPKGSKFGNIEVKNEDCYLLADGRKAYILHGDKFDAIVTKYKLITKIGGILYDYSISLNNIINWFRRKFGLKYWSFSGFLKQKSKSAINIIYNYENLMANYAKEKGYDVIISGHIHNPEIKDLNGIQYINCGDFVENCTAVFEDKEGQIEIKRFF